MHLICLIFRQLGTRIAVPHNYWNLCAKIIYLAFHPVAGSCFFNFFETTEYRLPVIQIAFVLPPTVKSYAGVKLGCRPLLLECKIKFNSQAHLLCTKIMQYTFSRCAVSNNLNAGSCTHARTHTLHVYLF